jgi:ribosomal protein S18
MIKKGVCFLSKQTRNSVTIPFQSLRAFASGTKLEKFDYLDPLCLEDLLTEEEKMIRDSARGYTQEKLMPRIREAYNQEKFDTKILREMGE